MMIPRSFTHAPSAPQLLATWASVGLLAAHSLLAAEPAQDSPAKLVQVRRIWDQAPHNAFTDLIFDRGRWLCVFREGSGHVSPDGAVQVLMSADGQRWESLARLASTNSDLRDPKITRTPDGRLMVTAAAARRLPASVTHQSMTWFSRDGRDWQGPNRVGEPDVWLWRATWHQDRAYGVGYDTSGEKFIRLYSSSDGKAFDPLVATLLDAERPNETALVFLPDERALCLLRRDGQPGHGLLGVAAPPYTQWAWKDLGQKIGGPSLIRLPDGRLVGGGRLYGGKVRTSLFAIDVDGGALRELLALPSGGDNSYPGLAWHNGRLWVSYYSSHEGKTAIYFAEVQL